MRNQRRQAFTLIEMLFIAFAIGILLGLTALAWRGIARVQQADAAAHRRLNAQAELAERFRQDVAAAVEALEEQGDLKAGLTCVLLRRPDGSHVSYRWDDAVLERREGDAARPVPTGGDKVRGEFQLEGRRITLRLFEDRQAVGGNPREPTLEIAATLGGDLR